MKRERPYFRRAAICHNVLTDARKAGPSLRTLFGKVRLVNGKRATEQNVLQLITERVQRNALVPLHPAPGRLDGPDALPQIAPSPPRGGSSFEDDPRLR